jgi:hypothetical protein
MREHSIKKCEKAKARIEQGEGVYPACKAEGVAAATYKKWLRETKKLKRAKPGKTSPGGFEFEFTPDAQPDSVAIVIVRPGQVKEALRQIWQ